MIIRLAIIIGLAYAAIQIARADCIPPEDWGAPDGQQWLCPVIDFRPVGRLAGCQTPESPDRPSYADCGDTAEAGNTERDAPAPEPPEPQEPEKDC